MTKSAAMSLVSKSPNANALPETQDDDTWSPDWLSSTDRQLLARTAAALAHEIKNPLGSMRVLVSLLRQDLRAGGNATGEGALRLIDHIDGGIETISRLIGRVLDVAREVPHQPAPLNMASIIREEASVIAPRMRRHAPEVSVIGNPFLLGDVDGLHRVVANLLVNAGEATDWLGRVIATCDGSDGDTLVVTVQDDGPGIPVEMRSFVFEPFFSTKARGTGLGLPLVRETVRQHGGQLEISCGQGATFRVFLPRRP